jgi:two-component system, chemotaxis family, protein-glutamate methylesterase/glutaminase
VIRVVVADDSRFTCRLLASYLEAAGECEVIGMAHDAPSTIHMVTQLEPDVLTLDLDMPGGNGLELLQTVACRTAVVVVSGVTRRSAAITLQALERGALDFVLKYTPGAPVSPASLKREIVTKVTAAAAARSTPRPDPAAPGTSAVCDHPGFRYPALVAGATVIVIGASTGGPAALRDLVRQLPADFATPCLIIQHMPAPFTAPFAAQLARHAKMPVTEAYHAEQLEAGRLLVSPGGRHLLVRPSGRVELRAAAASDVYRPSIDLAMASAAEAYGATVTGVMLSGMGADGVDGMCRIRESGGRVYVQSPDSCLIASMPERTLERAGADFVGSPDRIGALLARHRS